MRLAHALLFCLAGTPAFGQTRPFATEEAGTGPRGRLTLELGASLIGAWPDFVSGARRTRWDGPTLRLVHSPADNVELDVEWTVGVGALGAGDRPGASDWGDVALRAKVRFVEPKPGRPGLAARFLVVLPETSADEGLGPNTLRTAAELLFSHAHGRFAFHANAGLAIQDQVQRLVSQDDFLSYGVAVMGRIGAGLSVGAEVAGLAGKGSPGTEAHHEARLGLRCGRGRWRADAALRRGLGDADGRWGATAGLTVSLR